MFANNKNGWWWHIKIYDYLTGVNKCFNSPKPFATFDDALSDLKNFIDKESGTWKKSSDLPQTKDSGS